MVKEKGNVAVLIFFGVIVCIALFLMSRLGNIAETGSIIGEHIQGMCSISEVNDISLFRYSDDYDNNNRADKIVKAEVNKYIEKHAIDNDHKGVIYVKYDINIEQPNLMGILFKKDSDFIKSKVDIVDDVKSYKYKGKLKVENKDKARVIKLDDDMYVMAENIDSSKHGKKVEMELLYNSINVKDNIINKCTVVDIKNVK